jgi:mannose-6-phosphate isomerase-like protein (cupin superfamily)
MADAYTIRQLTDVEDSAARSGLAEFGEARFATGDLEATGTGVALLRLWPERRQAFAHKHDEAEEVYVVLAGSGRVKLDDEIREIERLDALRIAPDVVRMFEAGPDGLDLIVFGPHHKGDGEIIEDWWTD